MWDVWIDTMSKDLLTIVAKDALSFVTQQEHGRTEDALKAALQASLDGEASRTAEVVDGRLQIYLYGAIGDPGFFDDPGNFYSQTDMIRDLKIANDAPVDIFMNSPGGALFQGFAMMNQLKRRARKNEVNVYIDGVAASAASIISLGATNVYAESETMGYLAYRVMGGYLVMGNATEIQEYMDKKIDLLNKTDLMVAKEYARKSGDKDEKFFMNIMEKDLLLSYEEAKEYGLIDGVREDAASDDDEQNTSDHSLAMNEFGQAKNMLAYARAQAADPRQTGDLA